MLAMSVNPLNDVALIDTDDFNLIGAVTDSETILYGNGMYVAVIDDMQSDIAQIKMYPNPVVNTATVKLSFNSPVLGSVDYQVLASNGQVVGAGSTNMGANMSFTVSVNEMNLVSGAYFLRIDAGNAVKLVPFLVQK
jgi:curli biogenesis system outer membrane secretion channel CsgG